ncbi:CPBP family intramembrane glutamic endopeptidase [Lachnospiraceae bacterium 54-53]
MSYLKRKSIQLIFTFYMVCFAFRAIEYFIFRTDQSVIGEAFIHKLAGILLLAGAVSYLRLTWTEIGFSPEKVLNRLFLGLLLGGGVFTVAYGAEIWLQSSAGNSPVLRFFVTSYSVLGNRGMESGLQFILICIVGNIINVIMEEGVFRGLFIRLAEQKYSFGTACWLSSLLFGVWHIMQPIRNVADGTQSVFGAVMTGLVLTVTSMLLGIQYCMLLKLTGSLWAGMAAHFINNTAVNLIHVITASGMDELQTVRISGAQTLSFLLVLAFYMWRKKHCLRLCEGKKAD